MTLYSRSHDAKLTDVPHAGLNNPNLPSFHTTLILRIIHLKLTFDPRGVIGPLHECTRSTSIANTFGVMGQPALPQLVIHCPTYNPHRRKRLPQYRDSPSPRDEESHKGDPVFAHAVVTQHADRHERRRARANLGVKQEDIRLFSAVSFTQNLWEHDVKKKWLASFSIGLDEERTDGNVSDDAPEATFERSAADVGKVSIYVVKMLDRVAVLRAKNRHPTDILFVILSME